MGHARACVFHAASDSSPNTGVRSFRLSGRTAWVVIREARGLDRQVPVDRRRRSAHFYAIIFPQLEWLTYCHRLPAVLEWVSIYWFSRAGPAASARIYYEMTNGGTHPQPARGDWTSVPLGVSYFPGELVRLPKLYVAPLPTRLLG